MDGCTDTVTSSASFCEEICLPKKAVINNNKSSLRRFDRAQKSKEVVYKSGSRMEDKETKLNKDVMSAKRDCKEQLDHDYTNNSSVNISTNSQQIVQRRNYFLKNKKETANRWMI